MNELKDLPEDIRAVIFDFDGTLAETNIDFAKMRRRIIGLLKDWELWDEGMDDQRYVLDLIAAGRQKLAPDEDRIEQFQSEADTILQQVELETCKDAAPFPGVVAALDRLREAGLKVGIVTRNCRVGVASVTSRYHLHHDVLSTRDDVVNVKPHPDHLVCALDLLGESPERAIMIGDHITDVQGAEGTGAYTIGVLTNHTTKEEFLQVGADAVFADVPAAVTAIIRARDAE
ncbi:MAG: HAD family hydrolase [Armatimonadota bacterium]